jgi:rRNA maturation protein Rpf1
MVYLSMMNRNVKKKIIITTSRRPPPRTRSLVKDLVGTIPNTIKLTRGHMNMDELAVEAKIHDADRVIIISSKKGNPSLIRFYIIRGNKLENISSLKILGVTLAREQKTPADITRSADAPREVLLNVITYEKNVAIVGEAIHIGLAARILPDLSRAGSTRALVINVDNDPKGGVRVWFTYKGQIVGPRLRVAPTLNPVRGVASWRQT